MQTAFSAKGRSTQYRHSRHKDSRNGSAVTSLLPPPSSPPRPRHELLTLH